METRILHHLHSLSSKEICKYLKQKENVLIILHWGCRQLEAELHRPQYNQESISHLCKVHWHAVWIAQRWWKLVVTSSWCSRQRIWSRPLNLSEVQLIGSWHRCSGNRGRGAVLLTFHGIERKGQRIFPTRSRLHPASGLESSNQQSVKEEGKLWVDASTVST